MVEGEAPMLGHAQEELLRGVVQVAADGVQLTVK
jgi:hypothetical protein